MKKSEYAASKGLTLEQLRDESLAFLECEGYDDKGNEYQTLDEWLCRKPIRPTADPIDGGRGSGAYGIDD